VEYKPLRTSSKIVRGILLILNFLLLILLLFAYASFHIKPSTIPYIAFAGLAYPYILLANLVFLLFWIMLRIKYAIVPLIIILLGWNHMGRLIQFGGKSSDNEESGKIKLISYNIQNFLKLNTSSTKYVTDFENETKILDFLKGVDADIVCLQEMLNDRESNQIFTDNLADLLNCPHYYYANYYSSNKHKLDAIATFSRFPIAGQGQLEYQDKSIGIFTDLVIDKDTVRVYNLHLASIHFRHEDYEFMSEITTNQEQEGFTTGTTKILHKMQTAFLKRTRQVDVLVAHFLGSPYPIVICGDFNDSPSSYAYNKLAMNKKDAFVESGSGFGMTYAGKLFPSFRIDYIFYESSFYSNDFKRHKIHFSDHYPISTYLFVK